MPINMFKLMPLPRSLGPQNRLFPHSTKMKDMKKKNVMILVIVLIEMGVRRLMTRSRQPNVRSRSRIKRELFSRTKSRIKRLSESLIRNR